MAQLFPDGPLGWRPMAMMNSTLSVTRVAALLGGLSIGVGRSAGAGGGIG